jgi:type I restriction enzyme S subunit
MDKILPEFATVALNSHLGRSVIEPMCATTAGNLGISASKLKTVPVPVPPLAEQRRIVAYLDDLHAKVESVKKLQEESKAELNALMPSILSRAFAGEL